MKSCKHILIVALLSFVVSISSKGADEAAGRVSLVPPSMSENADLTPYLAKIDGQIAMNTPSSTRILAATLEALHCADLYTHNQLMLCGLTTQEEREQIRKEKGMKGPRKFEIFCKIEQELMKRGGQPVLRLQTNE